MSEEHTPHSLWGLGRIALIYLMGYIASIWLANLAIQAIGFVPVGFGLMAPAGVFFVGFSLALRDAVQDRLGRRWVLIAILVGAALSALVSPQFAFASGVAFLVSEAVDWAIYTPIRTRSWAWAVLASNTVGAVVDSALFLWLAFGSLDFIAGQIVGKWESTLVLLAVVWIVRYGRGRLSERRGTA